jgi:hypothetical protein
MVPRAAVASTILVIAAVLAVLGVLAVVLARAVAPWLEQRFVQWAFVFASLGVGLHPSRDAWLAALERRLGDAPRWAAPVAVAAAAAGFGGLKLAQHWSFHTTALDLSLYTSVVESLVSGRGFWTPWLGRSFLSEHASFVLLAWAGPYAVWRSPESLLVVHAAMTALAGWTLAGLGRAEGLTRVEAAVLCLAFWCNPVLWRGLLMDVHPELLWPLCTTALAWAALRARWGAFVVAGVVALSLKEDAGLVVAPLCAWLLTRRPAARRPLVGMAVASVAWSAFALLVVIPWASPAGGSSRFLGERYGHLGASVPDIVWNALTHPGWWGEWLLGRPVLELYAGAGVTALVQPLAALAALAALPQLVLNRATDYAVQRNLGLYYGVPAFAVLVAAAPAAVAWARARLGAWAGFAAALSLAWPTARQVTPPPVLWPSRDDAVARRVLRELDERPTCVQSVVAPHLPASRWAAQGLLPACGVSERLVLAPGKPEEAHLIEAVRARALEALEGGFSARFVSRTLVVLERGPPGPLDGAARATLRGEAP